MSYTSDDGSGIRSGIITVYDWDNYPPEFISGRPDELLEITFPHEGRYDFSHSAYDATTYLDVVVGMNSAVINFSDYNVPL